MGSWGSWQRAAFYKNTGGMYQKNGGAKQGSCLAAHPANGGFAPGGEARKRGEDKVNMVQQKNKISSILFAQNNAFTQERWGIWNRIFQKRIKV